MRTLQFAILLASLSVACGSDQQDQPACRAGTPEPIFSADDPWVQAHNFERTGQLSREVIVAASDSLVVEQAGCDTLVQAFEFTVTDSVDAWPSFRREAARRLRGWARRGQKYFQFEQYANAVEAVPPDYPTGRPADLAPGLTMRAYPLPTSAPRRWMLRFEQDLSGSHVAR